MGADAPCEEMHHYGATAAHMQIAEQCGTVGPAGQSALFRAPLRRLFLMNIGESRYAARAVFGRLHGAKSVCRDGEVDDNPSLGLDRMNALSVDLKFGQLAELTVPWSSMRSSANVAVFD